MQNPLYTEDQIENSFNDIIRNEFNSRENNSNNGSKGILYLFRLLDADDDGIIDTRSIPYERLSSQLTVSLRSVLNM